jgi:hypothetical protein
MRLASGHWALVENAMVGMGGLPPKVPVRTNGVTAHCVVSFTLTDAIVGATTANGVMLAFVYHVELSGL